MDRLQKPTSLAGAISLATHADHTVWAGSFRPSPVATTPSPISNGDGQAVPMELDAAQLQRPKLPRPGRPVDKANIVCWCCGKRGHMRHECKNRPDLKKLDVRRAAQSN